VVDEYLGPPETRPRDRDFIEANDLAMRLFLSNTKNTSSLKLNFSKSQPQQQQQQQKQHRTLLLTHLIENRRPVFEIIRTNSSKQINIRGGGNRYNNNKKETYSTIKQEESDDFLSATSVSTTIIIEETSLSKDTRNDCEQEEVIHFT
jgi:hypothetical protein